LGGRKLVGCVCDHYRLSFVIDWKQHIESSPEVLLGKPVIAGTRISVEFVLERLAQGAPIADLVENHPGLTEEKIQAVIASGFSIG
jgi:uncharacterized protein (DUF433 family)